MGADCSKSCTIWSTEITIKVDSVCRKIRHHVFLVTRYSMCPVYTDACLFSLAMITDRVAVMARG